MKQFAKLMLLGLGFGILALVLSSVPIQPLGATGSAPVTVVNTPLPVSGNVNATVVNTPLPVSLQGTGSISGTVNVGNFPATQPVSGTVGISGTPSVNVANTSLVVTPPAGTTHLGQDVNSLVSLYYDLGAACLKQNFPIGSIGVSCFSVPSGEFLVVTDVEWTTTGGTEAGIQLGAGLSYTSELKEPDSIGFASGHDHLTTGIVFGVTPAVVPYGSSNIGIVTIGGYLISSH